MTKDIMGEIPTGCVPGVCTKTGWEVFNCDDICDVPAGLEESIACASEHSNKRNEKKSGGQFVSGANQFNDTGVDNSPKLPSSGTPRKGNGRPR